MDTTSLFRMIMGMQMQRDSPHSPPLPFNKDSTDKFKALVISGKLPEELSQAYEYVNSLPAMVPTGVTVAGYEAHVAGTCTVEHVAGPVFAASLSQLVVEERALSTIDYAGIGYVIDSAHDDAALRRLLGIITVHPVEGEQCRFVGVDKHAEVDALCLLMFWHSSNSQVHSRLIALASDLVFLYRSLAPLI